VLGIPAGLVHKHRLTVGRARTGWPIWLVRSLIEGTVLVIGWYLGGNVGLGTLAFALLIGPLCGYTLPLFGVRRPEPAPALR